jgi:hypothetical protein
LIFSRGLARARRGREWKSAVAFSSRQQDGEVVTFGFAQVPGYAFVHRTLRGNDSHAGQAEFFKADGGRSKVRVLGGFQNSRKMLMESHLYNNLAPVSKSRPFCHFLGSHNPLLQNSVPPSGLDLTAIPQDRVTPLAALCLDNDPNLWCQARFGH